ncbi:MAG: tRNA (guanosine(37)-N1)-methyltransferase TrmD, partial [Ruthenibacterium sp.]
MQINIATLFPEMCERVLSESIIGRARTRGYLDIHCHQIREYTTNRQNQVDDYPYGGGVYVMDGATFQMNGGTISNNSVTSPAGSGGGIMV